MKSLFFILLFYYASAFDEGEVSFCIFTSQPRNFTYKDFMELMDTGFDKDLPTVFFIHGFQSGYSLLETFRDGKSSTYSHPKSVC